MSISASKMTYGSVLRKDMFRRQDTEDMIVAAVSKDGMQLRNVQTQTRRIVYAAVEQNWRALKFVEHIDEFLARQAARWHPQAASLLPPEHHINAVVVNIDSFDYITKPSMHACRYVIGKNPDWISKRPNPPMELCLLAVQVRHKEAEFRAYCNNGYCSPYNYLGKNYFKGIQVSEELARASLKLTEGYSYLSFPNALKEKLAEETLRINKELVQFMTLTPDLQDVLLNIDGMLIKSIDAPTEKQQILACRKTPQALQHIKKPARAAVWESAIAWKDALKYATEQDEELCAHAVRHFTEALKYVKDNPLRIWLLADAPLHVSPLSLFPKYAKHIHTNNLAYMFFRNIAVSLHNNRKTPHDSEELIDHVSMEPVAKGTIVAYIGEHFVGTMESLMHLLDTGFRGSNFATLFIPIRNELTTTRCLKWYMV